MTETAKGISVSCANGAVYVRVVGRGTFQNGPPLRRFALEMIKCGRQQFIIDLGQCQGMDSSFLGTLAGIGLRLHEDGREGEVHVIEANAHNTESLQTLGLDRLLDVVAVGSYRPDRSPPADTEFRGLPDTDIAELCARLNKNDAADLMLEAHDNLIQADQRNAEKFEELTRCLRDRVEKRAAAEKKQP